MTWNSVRTMVSVLLCAATATAFVRAPAAGRTTSLSAAEPASVVVVSPPGGVGEVSAVEAAKRGALVRWFVVRGGDDDAGSDKAFFSEESLRAMAAAGGRVELAGSTAAALLLLPDDPDSATSAVRAWCGESDAVIGCVDSDVPDADVEEANALRDAVLVAAREASKKCTGVKVSVGAVSELEVELENEDQDEEGALDIAQFLPSFMGGGKKAPVPSSLKRAMGSSGVVSLRHGELFGVPESSRDVSPFIGGPRRDPKLREEYTTRAVRLDPSIAILANPVLQSQTKSSRLSVGAAAALLATKSFVPGNAKQALDVCLVSLRGTDVLSESEWKNEFRRVEGTVAAGGVASSDLFSADFSDVPDVERMAEWLATKWAPAILRTYEIAGIRVGARPVYASKVAGADRVEIVWQKLENFESLTVGKIVIDVSKTGLVARRASAGGGAMSIKPLAGEDVIVRSLADAAAQAVEKGLAIKPIVAKKPKKVAVAVAPARPASTVVSSGTIETTPAPVAASLPPASSSAGPRSAGKRRSSERTRGKRRKQVGEGESKPKTDPPASDSPSSDSWQ